MNTEEQPGDQQDCAPPHIRVQVVEHDFVGGRVHDFVDSRSKNKGAGHAKAQSREEPDGEMTSGSHANLLPENDLQYDKRDGHNNTPENGAVKPRGMLGLGNGREAIDNIPQLRVGFGFGHQADYDRDDHANQTAPKSTKHVLRLILG